MLEELPAGRGTEGRDGEVGAQDDAGRRVGGSGAGCVSHVMTCVFILRAMENHRKVLNKKEIGSTLILTPASRHSRSGAGQMGNLEPKRWSESPEEAGEGAHRMGELEQAP